MSSQLNIEKPLTIGPDTRRREAASSQIQHFIRANQLKPGDQLPPVRKMSESFNLSRDAVWRALRTLQSEGWIDLQPNKRYTISENLYKSILRSIRVRALFSGKGYIYFSGFRHLADALTKECLYHNIELKIDLLPPGKKPSKSLWKNCDVLLIDSDSSGPMLETFDEFPLPAIGLDANYSERYWANIVTDHHLGGRIAAEAMLKRREKKAVILYYNASENNPRVGPRIEGFRQAWLESGRSEKSLTLVPIPWSRSSFEVALNVQSYLKEHPAHGNYFSTDGRLATNFLEVLAYQKVDVPGKVRVIGYDGAQRGELTDPPMTTIQQDMGRIAQSAVTCISRIVSGEESPHTLDRVPPLLALRGSF